MCIVAKEEPSPFPIHAAIRFPAPAMVIDKPRLDRDHVLQQEARQTNLAACMEHLARLLAPDERLGRPERRGRLLVIPIHSDGERDGPPASPMTSIVPN